MDHTNQLLMETEGLEDKKHSLLTEIEALRKQTEELEYILEAHKANCKMNGNKCHQMPNDIKPMVTNGNVYDHQQQQTAPQLTASAMHLQRQRIRRWNINSDAVYRTHSRSVRERHRSDPDSQRNNDAIAGHSDRDVIVVRWSPQIESSARQSQEIGSALKSMK